MPDAVRKNLRRLMPSRPASTPPTSLRRASTRRCCSVCGAGRYSSLETIWVGMGEANGASLANSKSLSRMTGSSFQRGVPVAVPSSISRKAGTLTDFGANRPPTATPPGSGV